MTALIELCVPHRGSATAIYHPDRAAFIAGCQAAADRAGVNAYTRTTAREIAEGWGINPDAEPAEFEIERVLICGVPIPFDRLPETARKGIEEQIEIDVADAIEGEDAAAEEFRAEARRDGE